MEEFAQIEVSHVFNLDSIENLEVQESMENNGGYAKKLATTDYAEVNSMAPIDHDIEEENRSETKISLFSHWHSSEPSNNSNSPFFTTNISNSDTSVSPPVYDASMLVVAANGVGTNFPTVLRDNLTPSPQTDSNGSPVFVNRTPHHMKKISNSGSRQEHRKSRT